MYWREYLIIAWNQKSIVEFGDFANCLGKTFKQIFDS